MTPLHAQLISSAVRARLQGRGEIGRVHSLFRHAANVLSGDRLLTIAHPQVGALPNGLVLREVVDFPGLDMEVGMVVQGDGGRRLLVGANVAIDLEGASTWSPLLVVRARPPSAMRSRLSWKLDRSMEIAAAAAPTGGLGPLLASPGPAHEQERQPPPTSLSRIAEGRISALSAALEGGDLPAAIAAAGTLIGLGDGLTPSGDDFLAGLCAALWALGHPVAAPFAAACAQVAHGRTTLVAETLLAHAGEGEFAGRVHVLLDALLADDSADPRGPIEQCLRWGSTSGADCLLGVLLGLRMLP